MNRVDAVLSSMFVVCTIFSVSSIGSTGPCEATSVFRCDNTIGCGSGSCVGSLTYYWGNRECINADESPCSNVPALLYTRWLPATSYGAWGSCTAPGVYKGVSVLSIPWSVHFSCPVDHSSRIEVFGGSDCL